MTKRLDYGDPRRRDPDYNVRIAGRHLAQISEANRDVASAFLNWKVHRDRRGLSTAKAYAQFLRDADRILEGKSYVEADHLDWDRYVQERSRAVSAGSLGNELQRVKHFLRWMYRERIDPDLNDLPYRIRQALTIRVPNVRVKREKPLTERELDALLEVARNDPRQQCLYMLAWDSGCRVGELLALNLGDVDFQEDAGVILRLPMADGFTKTGERAPYVLESVPWLRAYMDLHPLAGDDNAPLFVTLCRPFRRATYNSVYKILQRHLRASGLRNDIHWHLFRKTSATRRARTWNPDDLRAFHGWAPGSKQVATYLLHAAESAREQVRRDAGLPVDGTRPSGPMLTKACPMCAEDIKVAARKCKYCNSTLAADITIE